jgi:hypothetical protein
MMPNAAVQARHTTRDAVTSPGTACWAAHASFVFSARLPKTPLKITDELLDFFFAKVERIPMRADRYDTDGGTVAPSFKPIFLLIWHCYLWDAQRRWNTLLGGTLRMVR